MRMRGCTRKYVVMVVFGVMVATLGGVLYPVVDHVIREEVKKKVIIADNDDSESYEIWQDNPIPLYMQFFMFNVENHLDILNGEKPVVTQRGPYTYRERRVKFDIVWNEGGTATYRQNRTFHFIREMSVGPDSDVIQTLNPVLASLAQAIKWIPPALNFVLSTILYLIRSDGAFIRRPVRELVFGYDDPNLVMLQGILPQMFNRTNIGYFMRKNDTTDGPFTVETGSADLDHLGIIRSYKGKKHVDIWSTPWANMVNGSDGTSFPPFKFDRQKLSFFLPDICRSFTATYRSRTKSPQGVKLRRFIVDADNFENATTNPNNLGFCTPQTRCLPRGLHNSTMCEKPVDSIRLPVIGSFPHFLYADPSVQNSVVGLHPHQREHQSTVDVEPWTGIPMQINNRAQVNFFVEQVPGIQQLKNIRTLFFPILWLNESIVVDDKHADLVKDDLYLPMDIMRVVKISLIVIGGLLVLTGLGLFWRNRRRETNLSNLLYNQEMLLVKEEKTRLTYGTRNETILPSKD